MTQDFIRNPSTRVLRQFGGIWLPLAIALLGRRMPWFAAAVTVSAASWMRPGLVWPLWVLWMTAMKPAGYVISTAALAIIYFLVLTPTALMVRALRRDYLGLEIDRARPSYWTRRPPPPRPERYYREF